jgi:hypothetical protein
MPPTLTLTLTPTPTPTLKNARQRRFVTLRIFRTLTSRLTGLSDMDTAADWAHHQHGHCPRKDPIMRSYPLNSKEAAARIVALALTSDGHVCSSEERALEKLDIAGELGLAPAQFAQILQTLCEDRSIAQLSSAPPMGRLDTALLATLIDEIDDPALRRKVIRLCVAVTVADDYLADGEIALLAAVFDAWGHQLKPVARRHGFPSHVMRNYERALAIT